MIINKVEVNNFFCYVGLNEFEFDKGLNIVAAKNSGGKSHLFNAFHWTFFNNVYVDREKDTTKKEWKSADKVNTLPDFCIENSNEGDVVKTSIKINLTAEFHDNDDPIGELIEYNFEKQLSFKKGTNDFYPVSKPELEIWYIRHGETKFLTKGEHTWFLNKIFPISIRKFMWFQGETVDELYDFSKPSTLNYAIQEISYYPVYENMAAVTKASESSISNKIDKESRKLNRLTNEQEIIIADINQAKNRIKSFDEKIIDTTKENSDLEDAITTEENKLKGLDKYSDLKTKLNKIEYDIKSINDKIDNLSVLGKEKFISKWMLNKCDSLIDKSSKNLDILSMEIKSMQNDQNPVPKTLPGPEYVQKMIDDGICYICERKVEEGSPAYISLKSRLEDFKNNQIQKILADNYTELNRFKRGLLIELPGLSDEVKEFDNKIEKLINKRKCLVEKKENLYKEFGIENADEILIGSTNAEQTLNKLRSLSQSKEANEKRIIYYENQKLDEERNLKELYDRKVKTIPIADSAQIAEVEAKKYVDLINLVVTKLKNTALVNLLEEITVESNSLYKKYTGGNPQGVIEIDKGIRIIDRYSKRILTDLNSFESIITKFAVANAFLSLSEKKMNNSFPLIADAPTSDFDYENTIHLTENIHGSFEQIIIMSKDYNMLKEDERIDLIKKAKVSKYYQLVNDLIDRNGLNSRSNKKTYIKDIK